MDGRRGEGGGRTRRPSVTTTGKQLGQYRSEISGCGYGVLSRTFDDYQLFTTLRPCDWNANARVATRLRTDTDFGPKGRWGDGIDGVLIFTRHNRTVYRLAPPLLRLVPYGP